MTHIFKRGLAVTVFFLISGYIQAQVSSTFAGSYFSPGTSLNGDGGAATSALLGTPKCVAVGPANSVYFSEHFLAPVTGPTWVLRKVDASGIIHSISGTGSTSVDGILAVNAAIAATAMTVDGAGNIYVAEGIRIRKINTLGVINTIAGSTVSPVSGFSGDGGAATAALFNDIRSLAVDASGNVYVADYGNNRIRKIDGSGIVTTFAGNGTTSGTNEGVSATSTSINGPNSVAVDALGNVYIATRGGNQSIYKINTSGIIHLFAFSPNTIGQMGGIALDGAGHVFYSYTDASSYGHIQRLDTNNNPLSSYGIVYAGSSSSSSYTENRAAIDNAALVGTNYGSIAVTATDAIYICGENATMIEKISPPTTVSISASSSCTGSVTLTATVVNAGIAPEFDWYKRRTNFGDTLLSSGSSNVYTTSSLSTGDTVYCVYASFVTQLATSSNLIIPNLNTVTPLATINVSPGNTITAGTSVTFTVTDQNGGAAPSHVWKKNGSTISGATSNTYTTNTLANNDVITCVLTSNATCATPTTATSSGITMTVNAPVPTISINTSLTTICAGVVASFTSSITNAGSSPTYQWNVNGNNVGTGTNSYSYTPTNTDIVTCVLTVSGTNYTSNPLTMTVNAIPATPTVGSSITACTQTAVTLGASSTTSGVTYTWSGPNSFASAIQNPSISNIQSVNAGTYSVTASKSGCISTANTISLTVVGVSNFSASSNTPVTVATNINLTATTVGGATYSWTGPNSFTSNLQNPTISNAQAVNSGTYAVTVTSGSCTATANTNVLVGSGTGGPFIASYSSTSPTNCTTLNGSITLNGLTANTAYTVKYLKNGQYAVQANFTSNGAGSIVISNLSGGIFDSVGGSWQVAHFTPMY